MNKREAEVLQLCADRNKDKNPTRKARELLLSAQQHYKKGLGFNRANHWHATQYLFLCGILGQRPKNVREWMTLARFSAREETRDGPPSQRAWAYASLLELAVLGIILDTDGVASAGSSAPAPDRGKQATEDAEAMLALVGMRSFEVYSTLSQFKRYKVWSGLGNGRAQALIEAIVEVLAAEGEPHADAASDRPARAHAAQNDTSASAPPESDERLRDEQTVPPPKGARTAT